GEAIARGDMGWVRRTLKTSIIAAEMVVLPLALTGLFFGDDLARLWFQQPIALGFGLLAGLALWAVLEGAGSGLAMFLNGASIVRIQVCLSVIFAATAIVVRIVLANQFGIAGIIWGTIVAYFAVMLVPLGWIIPRQMRKLGNRQRENADA